MKELSIIIPNYRTLELAQLCLRSLRMHTPLEQVQVLVVDNDSGDESTEYLRTVDWIELIERKTGSETGPGMHVAALNQALTKVETPYVLVMHTDTIILHDQWLDFLLAKIKHDSSIAGVGSWKLETISPIKRIGKQIENIIRRAIGKKIKTSGHFFRSHCALYRTEAVKAEPCGFGNGTAGEAIFLALQAKGYKLPFIESEELSKYLCHLNHATMILNPREGDRKTCTPSARRKLKKKLESIHYKDILANISLDKLST